MSRVSQRDKGGRAMRKKEKTAIFKKNGWCRIQ